jgi:hypothetical protein
MTWTGPMIAIAGAWLAVAPFTLQYQSLSFAATTEAVVVGLSVIALATWGALKVAVRPSVDYLLMVLGAWSVIAPFVLGYQAVELARNSDIVGGAVVAILAVLDWFRVLPPSHRDVTA